MNQFKHIGITLILVAGLAGCEQEMLSLTPPVSPPPVVDCPTDATAGSADFTKYVAIGNSLTAGYQAGAFFNEGQENSLGNVLASRFACVGGGAFNQPDINTENGFFTGGTNPVDGVVLGRLLLQGNPPAPAPTISNAAAIPNPIVNPGFIYAGDRAKLNNFGVPGITLVHMVSEETGDWAQSAHPLFNPFYARFASDGGAGGVTLLEDAITALANGGTFFSFWLGSNDVLGYAVGGASNPFILSPIDANPDTGHPGFANLFPFLINAVLQVPGTKGVVGNIPDVLNLPYFHLVPYNAIPLAQPNADALNAGFAGYNSILDAFKAPPFNFPAAGMDARKIAFVAGNENNIVITDEKLTDLGPYFDALLAAEQITPAQRASLEPYRQARQTTEDDLITLGAGAILGTIVGGNPQLINGLTIPLSDQYVLIPSEQTEIADRTSEFNTIIANTVATSDRLAFADVNAKYNQFYQNQADFSDGVTVTPTMPPPTGVFSEDGVHANSRGIAYTANIFIDAINAKFGAKVPKVNLAKYQGTALPIP